MGVAGGVAQGGGRQEHIHARAERVFEVLGDEPTHLLRLQEVALVVPEEVYLLRQFLSNASDLFGGFFDSFLLLVVKYSLQGHIYTTFQKFGVTQTFVFSMKTHFYYYLFSCANIITWWFSIFSY